MYEADIWKHWLHLLFGWGVQRRWQGDRREVCHSVGANATKREMYRSPRRGEKSAGSRESLSEDTERGTSRWKRKRDDKNWEKELGTVVGEAEWEKRGWELEEDEYMKASCINGKVKSRLRINYPVSPGITNVIIWTRVLIRMCRGVEDPLNKMGARAGRV